MAVHSSRQWFRIISWSGFESGQRRLPAADVDRARILQNFGRLIDNSDMHSCNLALFADLAARPRFSLAPAYDMLPMRRRPDAALGGVPDYAVFELDSIATGSPAHAIAREFWGELAGDGRVGRTLRQLSREMAARLST